MEVIKTLFEDKLLPDTRDPITVFSIPTCEGEFGLFAPQADVWKKLSYLVALQIPIQCAFAAIIYTFIVKKRGTPGAYLLGWGLIIPAACILPYYILELVDVHNKVIRLALGNVMTIVSFRCIEAMYSTFPNPAVEASISNYVIYYTALVPFVWDSTTNSPKRSRRTEVFSTFLWLFFVFHAYSLLLSFMIHHDFKPYANDAVKYDRFHLNLELFTPQHLANGYLMVVLTFLNLSLAFGTSAFGLKALGFSTVPIFLNPLFASSTPTEFWTKRWNVMIHQTLKYGIFHPVRKMFSPKVAILVTLVVSGLYHEYIWDLQHQCLNENGDHNCHKPIFGRLTMFFFFTGLIILLERPVSKLMFVRLLSRSSPIFITSTLLVLMHVPFAHWYYGDWVQGGYFNEFAAALWQIKKL